MMRHTAAIAALLFVNGCASYHVDVTRRGNETFRAPSQLTERLTRPPAFGTEIARIAARGEPGDSQSSCEDEIFHKARALGADAVMIRSLYTSQGVAPRCTGVAYEVSAPEP